MGKNQQVARSTIESFRFTEDPQTTAFGKNSGEYSGSSDLSSFQVFLSGGAWAPVFFVEVTKPPSDLVEKQATLAAEYRVQEVLVVCLFFTYRNLAAEQMEREMHSKKLAESVQNLVFCLKRRGKGEHRNYVPTSPFLISVTQFHWNGTL